VNPYIYEKRKEKKANKEGKKKSNCKEKWCSQDLKVQRFRQF